MKIKEVQERNPNQSQSAELTKQQFEESAQSALDAVCRSEAQTYDQFMSSFTYLTPDDVRRIRKPEIGVAVDEDAAPQLPPLDSLQAAAAVHVTELRAISGASGVGQEKTLTCRVQGGRIPVYDPDALEEQVLEEGQVTQPYLLRNDESSKSLRVKLGNFVEEDDSYEDEEGGYSPSFTTSDKEEREAQAVEIPQIRCESEESVATTNPVKESSRSVNAARGCHITKEAAPHGAIRVDSQTKAGEIAAKTIAEACVKSGNRHQLEENLLDLIGAEDSLSDDSDFEYDATLDLPNPGEIVEEKDTIVKDFVTRLNFTARVADSQKAAPKKRRRKRGRRGAPEAEKPTVGAGTSAQESENKARSDDVEAFSLDSEFDYDNVVLSPKYNAEEMALLLHALRATANEQAAAAE